MGLSEGHFCCCCGMNRISIRRLRLFNLYLFLLCLYRIEIVLLDCDYFLLTVTNWFDLRGTQLCHGYRHSRCLHIGLSVRTCLPALSLLFLNVDKVRIRLHTVCACHEVSILRLMSHIITVEKLLRLLTDDRFPIITAD